MTHLLEEQLILYYYGELPSDVIIESHLAECASCRESYRELQRALDSVESEPLPALPDDYEARVWRKVRAKMARPRRTSFGWRSLLWAPPSYVAAGAAVTLLVLVAFLVGRFWQGAEPRLPQLSRDEVQERVLIAAVADHLDRSQRALLELLNRRADGGVDISGEQATVRDIVEDSRILRRSAASEGEVAVAEVLEELERVLLDISNSSSNLSSAELADLRSRLESQSILFKLRVISSQLKKRQDNAARELARRSS